MTTTAAVYTARNWITGRSRLKVDVKKKRPMPWMLRMRSAIERTAEDGDERRADSRENGRAGVAQGVAQRTTVRPRRPLACAVRT